MDLIIYLAALIILFLYLSERNKNNKKPELSLSEKLHKQANEQNEDDVQDILDELETASNEGEYSRTIQLKVNQSEYIKSLGLNIVATDRTGFYKITW